MAIQYTVKPGDNLSSIAQQYGVNYMSDITGYRSGNPNLIYPGEVITISNSPNEASGTSAQQTSLPVPKTEQEAEQAVLDMVTDVADGLTQSQNQAIEEVGADNFDRDMAEQVAIEQLSPHFEKILEYLIQEIRNGREISSQTYQNLVDEATSGAEQDIAKLDITQAKDEKDFHRRLADVGATTDYNLEDARTQWEDRIESERNQAIEGGGGFSGRTVERMGELNRRQGLDMGEIARRGGVQQQALETQFEYDSDISRLARESVEKGLEFDLKDAELYKQKAKNAYGTGNIDQLTLESLDPTGDYSGFGSAGEDITEVANDYKGDIQKSIYDQAEHSRNLHSQATGLAQDTADYPQINSTSGTLNRKKKTLY